MGMQLYNCAVTFDDLSCPVCGKGKLEIEKSSKNKNAYKCNVCNAKFPINWVRGDDGEYSSVPLFNSKPLTQFINIFTNKERGAYYEKALHYVRDTDNDKNLSQENG